MGQKHRWSGLVLGIWTGSRFTGLSPDLVGSDTPRTRQCQNLIELHCRTPKLLLKNWSMWKTQTHRIQTFCVQKCCAKSHQQRQVSGIPGFEFSFITF